MFLALFVEPDVLLLGRWSGVCVMIFQVHCFCACVYVCQCGDLLCVFVSVYCSAFAVCMCVCVYVCVVVVVVALIV